MRGETGQNITLVISTSQGHGSTQNLGFCMVSTHPWSQPNRNHLMCQSKCARHPPFAIAVQISPHSQHWLTGSLAHWLPSIGIYSWLRHKNVRAQNVVKTFYARTREMQLLEPTNSQRPRAGDCQAVAKAAKQPENSRSN